MTELERIVDQLNRAFEGGAWHGPSVMEILEGISPHQAAARPLKETHSIWELVLHIAAWEDACRRRLGGERAELPDADNWPEVVRTDERAWEQTKANLRQAHAGLCQAVSEVDDARLDQPILQGMSSVYVTLHGVVQHTLYHAGQIAILKKATTEQERT